MRAGKLDRIITLQRAADIFPPNDAGTPVSTWMTYATLRAELVELTAEEIIRSGGATDEAAVTFRTRYLAEVRAEDRILFEASPFNIKRVAEIGRKRGLELRAERIG